jgi:hypothetical protein
MKRWSAYELKKMDDVLFAIRVLNERKNNLPNPYTPLSQKLSQTVKTLENVRNNMQGAEPNEVTTRDNRLAGGYILLSTYATLTDEEAMALRDTDETPEAVIAIKEQFLEEWIKPEYSSLDEFLGEYTFDTIAGLSAEAELHGVLAFEYREDLDDPFLFPATCPGDAMLAFADFLSGKLQENCYTEASKYLDCLFSF